MNMRRQSLNFAPRPAPRGRDGKELIQCPTSSCDGMGHISGNYATHRRQGIQFDINLDIDTLPHTHILIHLQLQNNRHCKQYIYIYSLPILLYFGIQKLYSLELELTLFRHIILRNLG